MIPLKSILTGLQVAGAKRAKGRKAQPRCETGGSPRATGPMTAV